MGSTALTNRDACRTASLKKEASLNMLKSEIRDIEVCKWKVLTPSTADILSAVWTSVERHHVANDMNADCLSVHRVNCSEIYIYRQLIAFEKLLTWLTYDICIFETIISKY